MIIMKSVGKPYSSLTFESLTVLQLSGDGEQSPS